MLALDADDFLAKDSIKIRKEFLDSHPDYNLVRSEHIYLMNII